VGGPLQSVAGTQAARVRDSLTSSLCMWEEQHYR
jgi:hypothetical protein